MSCHQGGGGGKTQAQRQERVIAFHYPPEEQVSFWQCGGPLRNWGCFVGLAEGQRFSQEVSAGAIEVAGTGGHLL